MGSIYRLNPGDSISINGTTHPYNVIIAALVAYAKNQDDNAKKKKGKKKTEKADDK